MMNQIAPTALSLSAIAVASSALLAGPSVTKAADDLTNAALQKNGGRVSAEHPDDVPANSRTVPRNSFDGSAHSRMVYTGTPYTFTVELIQKLPVEALAFTLSDYNGAAAPKDLVIKVDGGKTIKHTLENKRPKGHKPAWQKVPINTKTDKITITVTSNYESKNAWGGMGDIAVLTPVNLSEKFKLEDHDSNAPTFVHKPKVKEGGQRQTKVTLPPKAEEGEHPSLLMGQASLKKLRKKLQTTERGKKTYKNFIKLADADLAKPVKFPDPEGTPAMMKDRNGELVKQHTDLSERVGTLGRAYSFTGDKKYAKGSAKVLLGYAQRYRKYPEHRGYNAHDTSKVMSQRLSEAMWLIPQLIGYDHIYDSGVLSDADHKKIEEGLIRPAIQMIRNRKPSEEVARKDKQRGNWRTEPPKVNKRGAVGNWSNFYATSTIMAGALLDDQDMIDLGTAQLRDLIYKGITENGMWGEGAIGYQLFALQAMVPGMETAARQGIDLWSFDNKRVKGMFDTPFRYAYPNGSMPGINDSGGGKLGGWRTMIYDYGYLRYHDQAYTESINESPQQLHFSPSVYMPSRIYEDLERSEPIQATSVVFGSLGYGILRNDKAYTLMDYGRHGGAHGHYDKLNLIYYALGKELGGEPVMHRYENSLHGEWTTQSIAHNTMSVDQRSQVATKGKLLDYEASPHVKLMRAEATGAYPGVLLDRTVLVDGDTVFDIYSGRSKFDHTWDRTLRYTGKLNALNGADYDTKPLGNTDGYQHIGVAKRQDVQQPWTGTWQTGSGPLHVTVAGAPGQEAILGIDPDDAQMAVIRQQGKNADFAVLRQTGQSQAKPSVKLLETGSPDLVAAQANTGGNGTILLMVSHQKGQWQAAGWTSDANVLYVKTENGKPVEVMFSGGTSAKSDNGITLSLDKAGNAYAKVKNGKIQQPMKWTPKE